jgi:hypothetical protein
MFTKKQFIILLVLFVVLAGAIILYQQTYKRWPWQNAVEVASPTITASPSLPEITGTPRAKTERDIIMEDVAQAIADISPVQPVLGGHWFVDRFWFVSGSDSNFYVEYEDGHILRRLLLSADLSQRGIISYNTRAFFEPGESDWILKSGQDQNSGLPLILYEHDDVSGRWVKKN